MAYWIECEGEPKHDMRQSEFYWIQRWQDGLNPCPRYGKPLHWYGKWRPQKSNAGDAPRPCEVLAVVRVHADDSPTGHSRWNDGYFPVLTVCRNKQDPDDHILWPRNWLAPQKYGQEAPQLRLEEWEYLFNKARELLRTRAR